MPDDERPIPEALAALGGHIEHAFKAKAEQDERTIGSVIRYVVVAEFVNAEHSRTLSYLTRDLFGNGIYPWEAMGMMDWARSFMDNCETCPAAAAYEGPDDEEEDHEER